MSEVQKVLLEKERTVTTFLGAMPAATSASGAVGVCEEPESQGSKSHRTPR